MLWLKSRKSKKPAVRKALTAATSYQCAGCERQNVMSEIKGFKRVFGGRDTINVQAGITS
jgi:hypothetical protein